VVGSNIAEFEENINDLKTIREVPLLDNDIKRYMKKRCPMNQMSVMFKKNNIILAGGYLDWYHEEDYYLWIRMALKNMKFKNLKEILVFARVSSTTYLRRGGVKYYSSEKKLQKYMYNSKIIKYPRYVYNIFIRFIVQILLPNKLRKIVFNNFARKNIKRKK